MIAGPVLGEHGPCDLLCSKFVLLMSVRLLECLSLQASARESSLTEVDLLLFLSWVDLRIISPLSLGNGHVIFNSINQYNSLAQAGSNISFMVCDLVEIPKDMVAFYLFESFHLSDEFPVVVGQVHTSRGLLQIEGLNDDSGFTNDSQLLYG